MLKNLKIIPYRRVQGRQVRLKIVGQRARTIFDHVGELRRVSGQFREFLREVFESIVQLSCPCYLASGWSGVDLKVPVSLFLNHLVRIYLFIYFKLNYTSKFEK